MEQGTILPGVTRASIMDLARLRGYTVEEVEISIHEALEADEVFTTGTAVVVCSVGSLTYKARSALPASGPVQRVGALIKDCEILCWRWPQPGCVQ